MIPYYNPVCPITNNRAVLFCCSDGCSKPAFACTQFCLEEGGHSDNGVLHRAVEWEAIEEYVRVAIELPLSREELQHLEKQ
jgi:hypothetical protein